MKIIVQGNYTYGDPSGLAKVGDTVLLLPPPAWNLRETWEAKVIAIGSSYRGKLKDILGIIKRNSNSAQIAFLQIDLALHHERAEELLHEIAELKAKGELAIVLPWMFEAARVHSLPIGQPHEL